MSKRSDFELERHAGPKDPSDQCSEKLEPSDHAPMLQIARKPSMKSGITVFRDPQGIPHLRVHDLKHTFGFRLRAANVDPMDRKDLLGHKNADISRLYSAPSIERLLEAAEKVVDLREPVLRVVGRSEKSPQKSPQSVAFFHHTPS
jgi:integrase